jgi:hypothetical protein
VKDFSLSLWALKQSRNGLFKSWTKRYFVLSDVKIEYFSDEQKSDKKGEYLLEKATTIVITSTSDETSSIEIKNSISGFMTMQFTSSDAMLQWTASMDELLEAMR